MIVKKRITNTSSVKGTLFFVHNLLGLFSQRGKKNRKQKKRKEENKKQTAYINNNK